MNQFQEYFVQEFVEDYKEGHLSRRDLIRRVLYISGGIASTAALLSVMGCGPGAQPAVPAATTLPAPASTAASAPVAATPAGAATTSSPPAVPTPGARAAGPSPSAAAAGARSPLSVPADDPAVEAQDVIFPGNSTTLMAYQARPRGATSALPLVLVCHENRGLTEHIRDVARRFAKHGGYLACAPDLLSREGGTAKVADPNQIPALLSGADPDRHVDDFQSAVDFYRGQSSLARADRIGMTGFCFGGGITWLAATKIADLKATVAWYGPTPPPEDVGNVKAAVFGIYAEKDTRITASMQPLQDALQKAGKTVQMKVYPGVGHAFHNDSGAAWNEQQALAAWADALAWFDRFLKA